MQIQRSSSSELRGGVSKTHKSLPFKIKNLCSHLSFGSSKYPSGIRSSIHPMWVMCSEGCKYLFDILIDFRFKASMWCSQCRTHCSRALWSSQWMIPDFFPSTVRSSKALDRILSVPHRNRVTMAIGSGSRMTVFQAVDLRSSSFARDENRLLRSTEGDFRAPFMIDPASKESAKLVERRFEGLRLKMKFCFHPGKGPLPEQWSHLSFLLNHQGDGGSRDIPQQLHNFFVCQSVNGSPIHFQNFIAHK